MLGKECIVCLENEFPLRVLEQCCVSAHVPLRIWSRWSFGLLTIRQRPGAFLFFYSPHSEVFLLQGL